MQTPEYLLCWKAGCSENCLSGLERAGRKRTLARVQRAALPLYATQLLNVGCRVTSIQKLLGHTNLNTTMTYARAFDQTVMVDYFSAIDAIEAQPDGAWHDLYHMPIQE